MADSFRQILECGLSYGGRFLSVGSHMVGETTAPKGTNRKPTIKVIQGYASVLEKVILTLLHPFISCLLRDAILLLLQY
jgi:hypothetical protein